MGKSTGRLATISGAISIAAVIVLSACNGAQPTATPQAPPTQTPRATAAATPTRQAPSPQATATSAPGATATFAPQATATTAPRATATPAPQATTAPTATVGAAGTPKYGGTLKRPELGQPPGFDAWRETTENAQHVLQTTYDSIVIFNPHKQDEIVPQLAESWTVADQGLTYTFKIRRGVKFVNGSSLTAQDIAWSLNSIARPPQGVPGGQMPSLLTEMAQASAPDDATVVVKLSSPNAAFLAGVAIGRMVIYDKEFVESEGRERTIQWPPMGSGPFMGKAGGHVRGVSTTVVKNPDYWYAGRPYVDGMTHYIIPDVGTQLAAFLGGQLNFGLRPDAAGTKEIQSRAGAKAYIQRSPVLIETRALLSKAYAPFQDIKVREAVSWAIDKDGFITGAHQGLGVVGGNLPPGSGWELPKSELAKFAGYSGDHAANIQKAKALLAQAGYGSMSATIWTRNNSLYEPPSVMVKAYLDEVGVKTDIQKFDDTVFFAKAGDPTAWQVQVANIRLLGSDPNFVFGVLWTTKAGRNDAKFSDPKLDQLYDQQNLTTDPALRRDLVHQMEKIVLGSYYGITLDYWVSSYAWSSNIKNFEFHVNYTANLQMRDIWME